MKRSGRPMGRCWGAAWSIRRTGAGTPCGSSSASPVDGVVELGYGIAENYRCKGYATEAVETILEWAFDQPGVNKIAAEISPDNHASRRVLEKCGFLPSGAVGNEGPRYEREPEQQYY